MYQSMRSERSTIKHDVFWQGRYMRVGPNWGQEPRHRTPPLYSIFHRCQYQPLKNIKNTPPEKVGFWRLPLLRKEQNHFLFTVCFCIPMVGGTPIFVHSEPCPNRDSPRFSAIQIWLNVARIQYVILKKWNLKILFFFSPVFCSIENRFLWNSSR